MSKKETTKVFQHCLHLQVEQGLLSLHNAIISNNIYFRVCTSFDQHSVFCPLAMCQVMQHLKIMKCLQVLRYVYFNITIK